MTRRKNAPIHCILMEYDHPFWDQKDYRIYKQIHKNPRKVSLNGVVQRIGGDGWSANKKVVKVQYIQGLEATHRRTVRKFNKDMGHEC